jgi:hypothetical protein
MEGMSGPPGAADPRRGPLGRVTTAFYWFLVVEVAFLVAASPGLIGILLLDRSPGNIPLYALCLVPLGPAYSAALSTVEVRRRADDLSPWPRFWRAWVRNLVDVLQVWVPALAGATILGLTLAFGPAAGVDGFFRGAAVVFLVVGALWSWNALIIASLFRFRARDTARLALYYLAAKPLVTLAALSFLVLATAVVAFTSDVVLAALAVLFAAFALVSARPMIADVTARFVAASDQ